MSRAANCTPHFLPAFPAENIELHGNNKTLPEIEMALRAGVHALVVDSHEEIGLIDSAAASLGVTACVSLRVKPGVEAHTHEYVMTGHRRLQVRPGH